MLLEKNMEEKSMILSWGTVNSENHFQRITIIAFFR